MRNTAALLITATTLLQLTAVAAGCSAENIPDRTGTVLSRPYVERVDIPVGVRAGSKFILTFTLALSEGKDPLFLGGPERPYAPVDMTIDRHAGGGTLTVYPYRPAVPDSPWTEQMRDIHYEVGGLPAGEYELVYYGAASREQFGHGDEMYFPLFQAVDLEKYQVPRFVVPFTVLP